MTKTVQKTKRRSTQKRPTKRRSGNGAGAGEMMTQVASGARDTTKSLTKSLKDTVEAVGRYLTGPIDVEFDNLRDLFIKELQDLYSAENQLIDALPKMAEAASSPALKTALTAHLKETKGQVHRLEQVFKKLNVEPEKKTCHAMKGLISEGDEWIKENALPGVRDAGIIAACQRVEHYEMAGYGCVRTYAQLLGHRDAATLLQATLNEEGAADKKLTKLSEKINVQAEHGDVRNDRSKRGAK